MVGNCFRRVTGGKRDVEYQMIRNQQNENGCINNSNAKKPKRALGNKWFK
jgi:hypothetical protein